MVEYRRSIDVLVRFGLGRSTFFPAVGEFEAAALLGAGDLKVGVALTIERSRR